MTKRSVYNVDFSLEGKLIIWGDINATILKHFDQQVNSS